jgi:hypothetical protein
MIVLSCAWGGVRRREEGRKVGGEKVALEADGNPRLALSIHFLPSCSLAPAHSAVLQSQATDCRFIHSEPRSSRRLFPLHLRRVLPPRTAIEATRVLVEVSRKHRFTLRCPFQPLLH